MRALRAAMETVGWMTSILFLLGTLGIGKFVMTYHL
jgi:hypothetical protein